MKVWREEGVGAWGRMLTVWKFRGWSSSEAANHFESIYQMWFLIIFYIPCLPQNFTAYFELWNFWVYMPRKCARMQFLVCMPRVYYPKSGVPIFTMYFSDLTTSYCLAETCSALTLWLLFAILSSWRGKYVTGSHPSPVQSQNLEASGNFAVQIHSPASWWEI